MRLTPNNSGKKFKVLFVPTDVAGVVYWRMKVLAEAMNRLPGISASLQFWDPALTTMNPWQEEINRNSQMRFLLTRQCEIADVVVFQKVHGVKALAYIKAIREGLNKPVVMEIDDDILHLPESNVASIAYRPGSEYEHWALEQMGLSDAVITTTKTLRNLYREYNADTHIVPNSIDFNHWSHRPKKHEGVRIGWVGGGNHSADLEMVKDAIGIVLAKHPGTKFYCVHCIPPSYKNMENVVPVEEWAQVDVYPEWVAGQGFDIGIAPLQDNFFNRGKSNLRYLEYSTMGIPTVASKVGHFKETIQDGVTGFLCETQDEWIDNLSLLIENEALRKEIGQRARKDVLSNFHALRSAKEYVRILKQVVKRGPKQRGELEAA